MLGLVVVVVLGLTVLVGTTLGGRYRVAPPVLLLVMGGALGLAPGLSEVQLDPEVVLLLFLPALLYWESLTTVAARDPGQPARGHPSSVLLVLATAGRSRWCGPRWG